MNTKSFNRIEAFNLLIDNHPDPMIIIDKNGIIIAINEKLANIVGESKKILIGKNCFDYLEKSVGEERVTFFKKIMKSQKSDELIDYTYGRWWKTILHPISDKTGKIAYYAGYIQDITEEKETKQKLEERENKLQDIGKKYEIITEDVNVGIYYTDIRGKFLWGNNAAAEIIGMPKEALIGKNGKDLFDLQCISKKDYLKAVKLLTLVKLGKKAGPELFNILRKDGVQKIVEIQAQKIKLHTENVILGIVTDITERQKTEEKIKESEEKYRQLVDNINEGLFTLDKTGRFTYINNIIEKRSGLSKEEFKRICFNDIVSKDYLEKSKEKFEKIINGEHVNPFEVEYCTKSRKKLIVEINAKPIYKEKKIIGVQCLSTDITEKKKSEKALKENELKLRNIIHHSDNLYYIHDTKQKITYVSPKSEKIFGYTPEEMKIKWTTLITENPMNEKGLKLTNKAITTGLKQDSYILEVFRKDGEKILVRINESPLKDENGRVIGITGVLTDITELKKAESEIIRRKEYLQNIIDSASEIIFTIDSNLKLRTWNKTAEKITGYKKKHVVGKPIKQIELFEYPSEIEEFIKAIQNEKTATIKEISINTTYGLKRTFSVSPSYVKDESNNVIEILFVCRDITNEKEKYGEIQSGNSYLIQESVNNTAIDIFNALLQSKQQGLYIGRMSNKELQTSFKKIIPKIIKLTAQKEDRYLTSTNIEELYQKIKEFIINKKNTVLLIDRLDYLIANYSFESIMKNLYKINDLIQKQNSILLIRVNPSIINQNQIAILNEEFKKLPSQKIIDIQISQELYEILTYIQNEGKNNIAVTYGNIGKTFSISKVTAKKRLESLKDIGLIYSRKQGKTKILNITEKGKNLLKHNTII